MDDGWSAWRFETVDGEDGESTVLLPGAPRAVARGCLCPAEKNFDGAGCLIGDGERAFVLDDRCPLHRQA